MFAKNQRVEKDFPKVSESLIDFALFCESTNILIKLVQRLSPRQVAFENFPELHHRATEDCITNISQMRWKLLLKRC